MRRFMPTALMVACVACGSKPAATPETTPKTDTPTPTASASSSAKPDEDTAAPATKEIPTACEAGGSCVMPKAFAKRLCSGSFPDVALVLFAKGTPWTRVMVGIKQADPFNGFGGPTSDQKLEFEEELLVVGERKPKPDGMSVSGAGASYDLLRWDGTCVALEASEVRPSQAKPKHANINWRNLEDATQQALQKDARVNKLSAERRKECKGATMGEVSAKCEKADRGLNDAIVDAVRGGIALPTPGKLP